MKTSHPFASTNKSIISGAVSKIEGITVLLNRRPELGEVLRIEFIGGAVPYKLKETNLKNILVQRPQVNYLQSLKEIANADCIISLDAPTKKNIFMSGKIADYIGARRPIVAITNEGATSKLITDFGGWIADPNEPEEIANAIEDAMSWCLASKGGQFGNVEIWESLQSKTVALHLLGFIEELN